MSTYLSVGVIVDPETSIRTSVHGDIAAVRIEQVSSQPVSISAHGDGGPNALRLLAAALTEAADELEASQLDAHAAMGRFLDAAEEAS